MAATKKANPAKKAAPAKKPAPARKAASAAKKSAAPAKAPAKKAQPAAKKAPAPAKKAASAAKKSAAPAKAPAKKAQPAAKKAPAPAKKAAAPARKAAAPSKKAAAASKKAAAPAKKAAAPAGKAAPAKRAATPVKAAAPKKVRNAFSAKFLAQQEELLLEERATYTKQFQSLRAEADSLVADFESGDVQFDEESGEGDTINIERERDLALSEQARQAIAEIDHALSKIPAGTYGICEVSGEPIPEERLEAIPWARERVEYKVGGLTRR